MRSWMLLASALLAARAGGQPASLSGFSDDAKFEVFLNEERLAIITSHWRPDGSFASTFAGSLAAQTSSADTTLTPDPQGRWTKAVSDDKVYTRTGDHEFTISSPKAAGKGSMPEDILTFNDESPALLTQALLHYDSAKGGEQTFDYMELHSMKGGPFTVERQETSDHAVAGRNRKLTRWHLTFPTYELDVLAASDGRVYLVSGMPWFSDAGASERHAFYVREGCRSLLPTADDPMVSPPKYQVTVDAGVKVPMRDGVLLSTDIYRPVGVAKAPVILLRTPYRKEMYELKARFFARRGYVFACQDVRGRFASEGRFELAVSEPNDGYDTIEWLGRQPWSTGRVGMIGASYSGWVQWLAAIQHPPHLVTIVPNVSPPDPFHNFPYDHGVLALGMARWVHLLETNATGELSVAQQASIEAKNFDELLKPLPVLDLDKAFLGRESPLWRRWVAHPTADAYWKPAMFLDKLKNVTIPVFHQSSWFDGDGIGSKLNYLAMAHYGHSMQKLTLGLWDHTDTASRGNFGPAAAIDLQRDYLRWFDFWLKGVDSGILRDPLVSMFVMGSNRWLSGPRYPLPETRFEKLYLASGGNLTFQPPPAGDSPETYIYDPGDPTPASRAKSAPARKDILVYHTPALEKARTLAGPISAVLYASTTARDTDWFIRLLDVDPDGNASDLWANSVGQIPRPLSGFRRQV